MLKGKMKKFFAAMLVTAMVCPTMVYADTLDAAALGDDIVTLTEDAELPYEEVAVDGDYYSEEPEVDGSYEEDYEPDTDGEGEAGNLTVGAPNLGTGKIGNPREAIDATTDWLGSYIYYGKVTVSSSDAGVPVRYRVLSTNTKITPVQYGNERSGMLLDCDNVIDSISQNSITETNEGLEVWNQNFLENAFDQREQAAIVDQNIFWLRNEVILSKKYGYPEGHGDATQRIKYQINDHDPSRSSKLWWGRDKSGAAGHPRFLVDNDGELYISSGGDQVCYTSPALMIDPKLVIFSSEILPETSPDASPDISPDTSSDYGKEYKLTVLDNSIEVGLTGNVTRNGNVVTVPYGITSGEADRVSVVITDRTYNTNGWSVKSEESTLVDKYIALTNNTFTLPAGYEGLKWGTDYNVYLIAEKVNGIKETDYASVPKKLDPPKFTPSFNYEGKGLAKASPISQEAGKTVEITAYPAEGYEFENWVLPGGVSFVDETTASSNPAIITMGNSDVKIKAVFKGINYDIDVQYDDKQGLAVAKPETAIIGTKIDIKAIPDTGFEFDRWEVVSPKGVKIANAKNAKTTFDMPASNVTVKALFKKKAAPTGTPTPKPTGTPTPKPTGTPTPKPTPKPTPTGVAHKIMITHKKACIVESKEKAVEGEKVKIKAIAKKGYVFQKWVVTKGGVKIKAPKKASTYFIMGKKNVRIKALFVKPFIKRSTKSVVIQTGKTNRKVKVTVTNDKLKKAKSTNTKVATVKLSGNKLIITGKKAGNAKINVITKSGAKKFIKVKVQNERVTTQHIRLSKKAITVKKGKYKLIQVTAVPDKISTGENIKFSSSDPKIAKVSSDKKTGKLKITGKKKGKCIVYVNAGQKTRAINVTVK